jgi:hypothetical protein
VEALKNLGHALSEEQDAASGTTALKGQITGCQAVCSERSPSSKACQASSTLDKRTISRPGKKKSR